MQQNNLKNLTEIMTDCQGLYPKSLKESFRPTRRHHERNAKKKLIAYKRMRIKPKGCSHAKLKYNREFDPPLSQSHKSISDTRGKTFKTAGENVN